MGNHEHMLLMEHFGSGWTNSKDDVYVPGSEFPRNIRVKSAGECSCSDENNILQRLCTSEVSREREREREIAVL